jgi:putative nucleotidyltransferase with HDIG domain
MMRNALTHTELLALVPQSPDWRIDWSVLWPLFPGLKVLDTCPQDPTYHAEGDVGTHTRMVVAELVGDPLWRALPDLERGQLFWAAVFHDIGKPATTVYEPDGRITSHGHSKVGAQITRAALWDLGVPFAWREVVCGIIAAHQHPFWLAFRPNPTRKAIEISWDLGRPDLICLHAEADGRGRISKDPDSAVDKVALARLAFDEAGCLSGPYPFANDESRVSYFEKPDRDPAYTAHEDWRCTVTVLSGLPGSGKDTWIKANRPDHPVVSLDTIREETGTAPTDNQGRVIQAAQERAREHLRARRDFVWNATNITRLTRGKVIRLLRDYDARVEIVYLEVPPDRLLSQNSARKATVPPGVIRALADKLEPPTEVEAHRVLRVIDGREMG